MEESTARKLQKSIENMRLKVIEQKGEAVKGLSVLQRPQAKKVKTPKTREVNS